jgi:rhamnulokinase
VTGLWLLHECRRAWSAAGAEHTFDELVELAGNAPRLRSLVDPNDPAFASPGDMPRRIRERCAATGQPEPDEPGRVVRCILESLALEHARVVEVLSSVTGSPVPEIHIVGGGARNELLCAWTAAAAGLPVLAGPEEATVLGNLLVQAVTLGELDSIADARDVVRTSFSPVVHEPEQSSAWDEARHRFGELGVESRSGAGAAA